MNDREFINVLIKSYFSNATNPYQATLYNTFVNRLNDIANKLEKQEKENARYKQLEKELGCPVDMILNLIINSNTLDEHCHTQDVYFDYKGKLISGSFVKLEYHDEFIIEVETDEMFDSNYDIDSYDLKVKDYKKTWWLKEDRSM